MDSKSSDKGSNETRHPDQLFDFLSGRLDESTSRQVDQHLSGCSKCSSVAQLVRGLKRTISSAEHEHRRAEGAAADHPDVSELAALFFTEALTPPMFKTAVHVSTCQTCADDLAEYARADRAAAEYDPARSKAVEIPAMAWDMIRGWEESSFAQPKSVAYPPWYEEQVAMLTSLLSQRREELRSLAQHSLADPTRSQQRADLVPVVIVDKTGNVRGVELFERAEDNEGNEILVHPEKSDHFHRKAFHAVLDFGEERQLVMSEYVRRHRVLLPRMEHPKVELRRADYFIIEDQGFAPETED